ncbi:hypothetical protein CWE09_03215 [Aliidiomarina minuta]|uniref:ABC-type transport auxiliary lipoprotein component domain-containing protein n=1 Tax=Aliidiomarina minuta TaxID=880057 RepID=A0A432W6Q5_9GAMM|nr:ABC-type transport auxiliary lipoprotein family protein [Aliidiomarina minuta]RUO25755.1 hypothetical protein CWE09_03215 [Aliidiomarina minuta]
MKITAAATLLAACFSMLLSGCSILPEPEQLTLYDLPASQQDQGPGDVIDVRLRVTQPEALAMFDTSRISVRPTDIQHSYYAGVRWSERAPVLVEYRIKDAFWDYAQIAHVSSDSQRLPVDYILLSQLRAFHSIPRSNQVRVEVELSLVTAHSREIVAKTRISAEDSFSTNDVPTVVASFGRAMDELSLKTVQWTRSELGREQN